MMAGRAKGTSRSALQRQYLKEHDPDAYQRLQEKQRERERQRRDKLNALWASGTRSAMEDREAFLEKRRDISRKHREKVKGAASRTTRTSASTSSMPTPRVNRKDMSAEERRLHDNAKRREAYHAKSKQKKTADRKKHAAKMRAFRQRKRHAAHTSTDQIGQTTPNASSTPQPAPRSTASVGQTTPNATSTPRAAPSLVPLPHLVESCPATPPRQERMRQHCYNVTSKVKRSLKNFSAEETASMTLNLVMRKTPDKRRKNIQKLLEHPEVKKVVVPSAAHKTGRGTASYAQTQRRVRRTRFAQLKLQMQKFYLRPDISRVLPHKRYSTKHGPGHVMLVTLDYAHQMFCTATGKTVSRSLFAKMRPLNVRKIGSVPTETCLCICCTNVKIKIDALNRKMSPSSTAIPAESDLLQYVLCPYAGRWPRIECIQGKCVACKDLLRPFTLATREIFHDEISWLHWERRPRQLADGQVSNKLDVFPYSGTVYDLLTQMSKDLHEPVKGTSYMKHLYDAYWQQSQYNLCKDRLQEGQVLVLQDFAKNRTATYTEEVKSAFFGKQQITLHPSVCYYKNGDGQLVRHVIACFSDDVKHDAHLVHAITTKTLAIIGEESHKRLSEVFLWSDGAASQYKGRKTLADLSLYEGSVERHFFGSEHGKGEADGETGRFSQAMKRASAAGHNFRHAQDMADFASLTYKSCPLKKYSFITIPLEDVHRDRPEVDVATIPGTRGFHQVVKKKKYCLGARAYSCFCCGCQTGDYSCCINKARVQPLEIFKLSPSMPQDEAFLEDIAEQENVPVTPVFSRTDCPSVGQWVEIIGKVQTTKRGHFEERAYKGVVIDKPDGGFEDFFYVQFLKQTPAGSYVVAPRDISHIHPDTQEQYRWRVIPAPIINNRNHHFFTV